MDRHPYYGHHGGGYARGYGDASDDDAIWSRRQDAGHEQALGDNMPPAFYQPNLPVAGGMPQTTVMHSSARPMADSDIYRHVFRGVDEGVVCGILSVSWQQ